MIATAFTNLSTNELWAEIDWVLEQPPTKANAALYHSLWQELCSREQRRQNLEDNFAWG